MTPASNDASKRGRPAGTTKANGAKVSTSGGRPASPRPVTYPQRLAHWRAWFACQQLVSAYGLAKRMAHTARSVQRYATSHDPPAPVLLNLETLSAAYGYVALVFDPVL